MPTKSRYLKWTVKQLTTEIRKRGLKGYSKLNKDGLAEILAKDDRKGKRPEPAARAVSPRRGKVVTPRKPRVRKVRVSPRKAAPPFPEEGIIFHGTTMGKGDPELNLALFMTIGGGRTDKVKKLLKEGADPNTTSGFQYRYPVLTTAATEGKSRIVKALIKAGANVNAADARGNTPLLSMFEVRLVDPEILEDLIEAGADINVSDIEGKTALIHTVNTSIPDQDMIMYLIEHGANPLMTDNKGQTALDIALKRGHNKIATMLKEAETKWQGGRMIKAAGTSSPRSRNRSPKRR